MIEYQVSFTHPHRQFINFRASFPNPEKGKLKLQLPAWRPGRYELGDFARYVRNWFALDRKGNELSFVKLTKDLWEVDSEGIDQVVIQYEFYANILNAGSTWLHEDQLYVNPVNCIFYNPEKQDLPYRVALDLPENYKVACGLQFEGPHTMTASDVQEMMDCPWIASPNIEQLTYEVKGVAYHIWIQGTVHFDLDRFVSEHEAFTRAQLAAFGDIPCSEYHFMYQFPEFAARHGVEHSNSTVIAMGEASRMKDEATYRELIGISCHELYHTWNIKNIRPVDMVPYDFSKENYSRLGYVAEGVTTYFGDQFLLRSGVFDKEEYFHRLATIIERHIHNPARFNYSVAESSFDTWLDGYTPGVPGRKVSIYNEGALTALMTDLEIIVATDGAKSLDDVMKLMYERFGKKQKGYSESDYRQVVEEVAGIELPHIFNDLIAGTTDYIPHLERLLDEIGVSVTYDSNPNAEASHFGYILNKNRVVAQVFPESPADLCGLALGDKVLKTPNAPVHGAPEHYPIRIERFNRNLTLHAELTDRTFYDTVAVGFLENQSAKQQEFYSKWLRPLA